MSTSLLLVILLSVFITGLSLTHGTGGVTDCYSSSDGSDYQGTVNTTRTGRACQRWDSAHRDHVNNSSTAQKDHVDNTSTAHQEINTDFTDFPDLYGDENYCRNPDGAKIPWCYTEEGDWDYCSVQKCETSDLDRDCFMMRGGRDYRGNHSVTETGKACLEWNSTHPHDHRFTYLEGNYCRNPDGESRPWCFTVDADTRSEYCDIKPCEITDSNCYFPDKAVMYSGRVNVTETGYPCQRWDSQVPHKHSFSDLAGHENYCRTPDGADVPWCYSTSPAKRWEICQIAPCDETTRYGCSGDWDSFGNSCYKAVKKMTSQGTAESECQKFGSSLAEIERREEQEYVFKYLSSDLCFNTFNETKCENWAASGECFKNPLFMIKKCRQSCDHEVFCNVDCEIDSHINQTECKEWSNRGECSRNPRWMLTHCAQSCNVCSSVTAGAFWLGTKHGEDIQDEGLTPTSHNPLVDGDCLSVTVKDGKLTWTHCDVQLPGYVCRKPKSYIHAGSRQLCDIEFNSTCYTIHLHPRTYADASLACGLSAGSGQLARITTVDERTHMSQRLHTKYQYYWVNAASTTTKDSTDAAENSCSSIQRARKAFGQRILLDFNCSEELPYICAEKLVETYTPEPVTSITSPLPQTTQFPVVIPTASSSFTNDSICGKGWVQLNNSCYKKLFHPWPWSRGRSHCSAIFGDLASVHNKEENDFILKQFPISTSSFLWIGLRFQETGARWTDNSAMNFSNFKPHPPKTNVTVNCVAISSDGTWTVKICSSWFPVLCKKPVKVSCGDLPQVDNAVVSEGGNNVGSYRKYSCKPGYTAGKGTTTIRCKEDLQWSAPLFKCYRNCYEKGKPYYGNYNMTESGKHCQRWDSKIPHDHGYASWPHALENYCRDYEHTQPWCYTVSGESRWENCNVPECQNETFVGKVNKTAAENQQRVPQNRPVPKETSSTASLFVVVGLTCVILIVCVILVNVIVILVRLRKSASYSNGEVQFENAIYMQNSRDHALDGRCAREEGEGEGVDKF